MCLECHQDLDPAVADVGYWQTVPESRIRSRKRTIAKTWTSPDDRALCWLPTIEVGGGQYWQLTVFCQIRWYSAVHRFAGANIPCLQVQTYFAIGNPCLNIRKSVLEILTFYPTPPPIGLDPRAFSQGLKLCVFWHKVCSWLCQVCNWLCCSVLCEIG